MGIRCADHVTPFYPQKLALTSPTGGGRSVGIVRSRTKATEFGVVQSLDSIKYSLIQRVSNMTAESGNVWGYSLVAYFKFWLQEYML